MNLKTLKEEESLINRHLFLIASVITVVTMGMLIIEFFTRGAFSPANMGVFYLGVLVIYSFHKELVRWFGKKKIERQGEVFIYTWIAITVILYIVDFATNNYYSYNFQGQPSFTLTNISVITIEVLAVFVFTRLLKTLRISFK